MVTASSITRCGKLHVSSTSRQLDQRLHSARERRDDDLAAPVTHIAEQFTIAGEKLLIAHPKWIGRYDRRGVKLEHGSGLSIWAMRALRRLDGTGDAG
jgi:hypothetical protein